MEREIKRGYVKWTDENGVFHKELLSDHPELLKEASPKQQLAAEEAKRQADQAEKITVESESTQEELLLETLHDLKAAPADVTSAAELTETQPMNASEETKTPAHSAILRELKEKTS